MLDIYFISFNAFSGTNLLTRCHSASSLFLLFLVSEKLLRKYPLNWKRVNQELFLEYMRPGKPKTRRRGSARRPHHLVARPTWQPRQEVRRAPQTATDLGLSPTPWPKNRAQLNTFSSTGPEPPPSSTLVREGSEALPVTLSERGIITGGLYITMPASGLMRE